MEISDFNTNGYLSKEMEDWTSGEHFAADDLYNLAIRINQFAQRILYRLRINNEDPQELLMSTLYIRVLGIYQGTILMVTKGMIIEAKILSRSLLEILYRIGAISKSKEIAIEFIRQDHITQKKTINKLNMLSENVKDSLKLSKLSEKYAELKDEISAMDIKERRTQWFAAKAELLDSYNTAYSTFSNAVHSNVRELESYLVLQNKDKVISFKYGPTARHRPVVLLTLLESMLQIIGFMAATFDLDISEELSELQDTSKKVAKKRFRTIT